MQRQPISPLIIILAVVAFLTACTPAAHYDGRLAAADSLMHDRPDSALAILQALHPDSLATQGDHAYRDLLLTQARYKCYITATTDSAINRALHYYRHHSHEQEKLTRAYIYKGAVMEELGHPDSAMHYYKTAEATAAPDDYFNLAYTKMRIATMYTNNYAMDGQDIKNYEEALKLFYKAHSKFYVFSCLHNLGCLYRDHEPQKAKTLLLKALSMSKEEKDTARIIEGYHALIVLYFYQQQYEQALRLIKKAIQTSNKIQNPSFFSSVSNVYARMCLPDSAMHYLGFAQLHDSLDDSKSRIYYIESLSEIALARGDTVKYLNLELLEKHLSDSLVSNPQKIDISISENTANASINDIYNKRLSRTRGVIIMIVIVFCLVFSIILFFYYNRMKRYHSIIKDIKNEAAEQLSVLKRLQHNIDKMKIKDKQTNDFIKTQLSILQEITIACYNEKDSKLNKQVKKIVQLQNSETQRWSQLYDYIDAEYNGILYNTRTKYPQLNDKDLLLISLCCLGFSYIQIAIIMGYSNATSIGTIKTRLSQKMGLNCSLNEYIADYTTPTSQQ